MVIRVGLVEQRTLRRTFLLPNLERRQFRKRRQIAAAAGDNHLLDRGWLRQMDQQALRRFLVLREIPYGPEIGQERREAARGSRRETIRPALLDYLRRVTPRDSPCAG